MVYEISVKKYCVMQKKVTIFKYFAQRVDIQGKSQRKIITKEKFFLIIFCLYNFDPHPD